MLIPDMTKEYTFRIDHQEREAIACGLARLRGKDPDLLKDADYGTWENLLWRAEFMLLAQQYGEQAALRRIEEQLGIALPNTSPQTP